MLPKVRMGRGRAREVRKPAEFWVGGWKGGKGRTRPPRGSLSRGLRVAGLPAGAQRRRRKGRRGAGRRVAVTRGGQFKPKEGKAAAPRERGVGVAIARHPWGRGGGSCPALPAAAACLPSRLAPRPGRCGRASVSRWAGVGGPGVCRLAGLRASPGPEPTLLSRCWD